MSSKPTDPTDTLAGYSLEARLASHLSTADIEADINTGGHFYGDPDAGAGLVSMEVLVTEIVADDDTWRMLVERRNKLLDSLAQRG